MHQIPSLLKMKSLNAQSCRGRKVLIFNKHSREISYEEIEGEIYDMSYSHTINHSGNGFNLKNFQY